MNLAEELSEKPEGEFGADDTLELTPNLEVKEGGEGQTGEGEGDGEEIVISIGDEAAPASEEAPQWVRELRKRNRELEKENAELKTGKAAPAIEVGEEPSLEGCEYDADRYKRELFAWQDRKAKAEAAKSEAEKSTEEAQTRFNAELDTYARQKDTLGVGDFEDAEAEVLSALSPTQQAILVQGAENKALVVYALGRSPEKLRTLAAITDPVKFAFAAARLEGQTKMERRPATAPEGRVSGSGPLGGGTDKELERLEKEADRTGDSSKLIAYRARLKAQAKR